jgi:hypothetical protein
LVFLVLCPRDVTFMGIGYQSMPFFAGALDTAIVAMSILEAGLSPISICPCISGVVEHVE